MASFDSDTFSTDAFSTDSFDFAAVVITVEYGNLEIDEVVFDTLIDADVAYRSLIDTTVFGVESIEHSTALTSFRDAVVRSRANNEGEIIS